jgi:serine/threonine protein phosphatase 1
MNTHITLPLDTTKRHFVIGDIHGRYDDLLQLLTLINYNEDTDMIYTVGDMIDRGDKSVEVFKFFTEQSNTWSCMGNHEAMVIDKDYLDTWLNNGGGATLNSLSQHGLRKKWLKDKIRKLPYVIYVGEHNDPNAFRIVHAEIPAHIDDENFKFLLLERNESLLINLIWSRSFINYYKMSKDNTLETFEEQPLKTFCGHTPLKSYIRVGNRFYIDTGYHGLTAINALTNEVFQISK